ncbi:hypothetical protein FZEAL_4264 [Fusarium zealandicum]|uniref:COG4 transport protein middle alpha-helical bundle domain-containing protein n=1 Tax=Fusarium zealandicum TaxID=1053134 RepID=A0A8H4UMY9_9HYPO|nr:hypothetical protein FZEAL_4264 [Fusarium zealandicum]
MSRTDACNRIHSATTTSDIRGSLAALRSRESEIISGLNRVLASRKDVDRELNILDGLRTILSAQLTNTRNIQNTMLASTADTADTFLQAVSTYWQNHSGLVRQHYGAGQMVKVIETLQTEADIQGGIILDAWADGRSVDKTISDVRSYPFTFLVQSILTRRQGGTGNGVAGSDTNYPSIDMKTIDGLLSEMTAMLERWSLYTRFIARQCQAFQIDLAPTGLSLTKPISGQPPFIIQAIDDVMYVADLVLQKVISASNRAVAASVIPDIVRVLESDLVGIIHRRMRDEYHPRSTGQGTLAPEDKVIKFIVMINSLDISIEYLDRLVRARADSEQLELRASPSLQDRFPFSRDDQSITLALDRMITSFSSKATPLIDEGIQVLFDEVVRLGLRPVLANSFRDVQYESFDESYQPEGADSPIPQASERFEEGWNRLMRPLSRLMTPATYLSLLTLTAKLLARLFEKRLWSFSGRVSAFGAIKMERDFTGMVDVISKGNYGVRELFARVQQICGVVNMDDNEWTEVTAEEEGYEVDWVLTKDEIEKARQMVVF